MMRFLKTVIAASAGLFAAGAGEKVETCFYN